MCLCICGRACLLALVQCTRVCLFWGVCSSMSVSVCVRVGACVYVFVRACLRALVRFFCCVSVSVCLCLCMCVHACENVLAHT